MSRTTDKHQNRPEASSTESLQHGTPILDEPLLIAYRTDWWTPMQLVRAPASRSWMETTGERFANRCLPLLMANQAGWFILNSHSMCVTWDGGDDISSLHIEYLHGSEPYPAVSHFGYGILTWNIPYLFRTPPGINLLVRGPANLPKDGVYPLEGLVETDWSMATFTMNWKLTCAGEPVLFGLDEPICMMVPQQRGALEAYRPEIRELESAPEVYDGYLSWSENRRKFLADLKAPDSEAAAMAWQKDYFQGIAPDGTRVTEHQTRLKLRDFSEPG